MACSTYGRDEKWEQRSKEQPVGSVQVLLSWLCNIHTRWSDIKMVTMKLMKKVRVGFLSRITPQCDRPTRWVLFAGSRMRHNAVLSGRQPVRSNEEPQSNRSWSSVLSGVCHARPEVPSLQKHCAPVRQQTAGHCQTVNCSYSNKWCDTRNKTFIS